jgi:hypothetical protein
VLQPTSINLPKMAAGEVFQGELILTNYGLIRADNVMAHPPEADGYYKFEFLAQPPTTLEAKQRVRLPYRVIALQSFGGTSGTGGTGDGSGGSGGGDGGDGSGDGSGDGGSGGTGGDGSGTGTGGSGSGGSVSGTPGCYTYTKSYPVTCKYTCANGVESTSCGSSANWFYVESNACPAGSNPTSSSGSGGWAGGGGWGGSGGPGTSSLPGLPLCTKGSGDCDNPGKETDGGNEGGQ